MLPFKIGRRLDILPVSRRGFHEVDTQGVCSRGSSTRVTRRRLPPNCDQGVGYGAYSPVNGTVLPTYSGRQQRGTTFHEQSGIA
jgi:hypothetical protein